MKKPPKKKSKHRRAPEPAAVAPPRAKSRAGAASSTKHETKPDKSSARKPKPAAVAALPAPRAATPRQRPAAVARSWSLPAQDRTELALLLAPVLFIAAAFGLSQTMKTAPRYTVGSSPIEMSRPADTRSVERNRAAQIRAAKLEPASPLAPAVAATPRAATDTTAVSAEPAPLAGSPPTALVAPLADTPRTVVAALPAEPAPQPSIEPVLPPAAPSDALAAREAPEPAPVAPPVIAGAEDASPAPAAGEDKCIAPPHILARTKPVLPPSSVAPADPDAFGVALAEAARAQSSDLVIYNEQYRRIGYPMGDVPSFFGVCTDVIIRAYRTLGIDLQVLVQQSRLGSGDTSIDHRRTETLRRFFAVHGESLPVTTFAEDYKPGDIVSYYRPQNRRSRSHIAVVAAERGPSGRLMIIHNRGWGVQLEDALFVDQITGHYRFQKMRGAADPRLAATPLPATPSGALPLLPHPAAAAAVAPRTAKAISPARARPAATPVGIPGKGAGLAPRLRPAGIAVSTEKR